MIEFRLEGRSGIAPYLQLVQQVKHALRLGMLRSGDQLPTVRQLAGELTIAPNTIVKAYNELQAMGLIESRQGVGTVVAASLNGSVRRQQLEALTERVRTLVRDAASLGIEPDELVDRLRAEIENYYQDRRS